MDIRFVDWSIDEVTSMLKHFFPFTTPLKLGSTPLHSTPLHSVTFKGFRLKHLSIFLSISLSIYFPFAMPQAQPIRELRVRTNANKGRSSIAFAPEVARSMK